jgi:hypothetical protein
MRGNKTPKTQKEIFNDVLQLGSALCSKNLRMGQSIWILKINLKIKEKKKKKL